MGLDITAHSKLVYINPQTVTAEQIDAAHEGDILYVEPTEGADRISPQIEGFYERQGEGLGFQAGSYGGYNHWRNKLSLLALGVPAKNVWERAEEYAGKPFVELIHFSDCEGWIGAAVSAKLAADFKQHRKQMANDSHEEYPRFMERYDDWARGFELAADNGAVQFH